MARGALLLVVGYAIYAVLAVAVFSIFLSYAVRPIVDFLGRFGFGRRFRALLSIRLFGLPFLALLAYAAAVVAVEIEEFLDQQTAEHLLGGLEMAELEALIAGETARVSPEQLAETLLSAVGVVGSTFVQLVLVLIATYYLLVGGPDSSTCP